MIRHFCLHFGIFVAQLNYIYRPQTKFAKVMFLQVSVCPHGGACMVAWGVHGCSGGCAWFFRGGWGHAWFFWGVYPIFSGGHAWLLQGGGGGGHVWLLLGGVWFFLGVHGFFQGGTHGFFLGGMRRIRRDTVNERAVRILLECILVGIDFPFGQTLSSERVLGRHVRCECMCLYWELKCKE